MCSSGSACPPCWGNCRWGSSWGTWRCSIPIFKSPKSPSTSVPELVERIEHAQPEDVFYQPGAIIKILAEIGVVLLLFEVGLESTVHEMLSVGMSSLLVAVLGVIAPMLLGWLAGWLLVRELGSEVHAFIGATLCATSVGITARVLKDLGRSKQRESQIILGAAVIDDVLGLVILTVVTGVISSGAFHYSTVGVVVLKAAAFLFGAVFLGAFFFTRPSVQGGHVFAGARAVGFGVVGDLFRLCLFRDAWCSWNPSWAPSPPA